MQSNFSAKAGMPGERTERPRDQLFSDRARRQSSTPCLPAHALQRRHEEKMADPGPDSDHVKPRQLDKIHQGPLREMVEMTRRIPMDPPPAEQLGLQALDIGDHDNETS